MHSMHDVLSRCKLFFQILEHNCKLDVKNAKNELIDQHMNAKCHMQSLKKDFYLGAIDSKIMNPPWKEQLNIHIILVCE